MRVCPPPRRPARPWQIGRRCRGWCGCPCRTHRRRDTCGRAYRPSRPYRDRRRGRAVHRRRRRWTRRQQPRRPLRAPHSRVRCLAGARDRLRLRPSHTGLPMDQTPRSQAPFGVCSMGGPSARFLDSTGRTPVAEGLISAWRLLRFWGLRRGVAPTRIMACTRSVRSRPAHGSPGPPYPADPRS